MATTQAAETTLLSASGSAGDSADSANTHGTATTTFAGSTSGETTSASTGASTSAGANTTSTSGDETSASTGFFYEQCNPPAPPALDQKCPGGNGEQVSIKVLSDLLIPANSEDEIILDIPACNASSKKVLALAAQLELIAPFWHFDVDIVCPSGQSFPLVKKGETCYYPDAYFSNGNFLFRVSDPDACLCDLAPNTVCNVRVPESENMCEFLNSCTAAPGEPWLLHVKTYDYPMEVDWAALTIMFEGA